MRYKLLSSISYNTIRYKELYKKRFQSNSTYVFEFSIKGNPAFIFMDTELLEKISIIIEYNKILNSKLESIPSKVLIEYMNVCLIDEIKMTNKIEGISVGKKEIQYILEHNTYQSKHNILYGLIQKYKIISDIIQFI